MSDIALFWSLKNMIDMDESIKAEVKQRLKENYPKLIEICPHSEALDWNFGHRGIGDYRVCMICGLEDHESQGGSAGDEYNYGYAGHPDREFWKDAKVRKAKDEKEFWSYRRDHGYRVVGGKVKG